jgi:hypothetical protein
MEVHSTSLSGIWGDSESQVEWIRVPDAVRRFGLSRTKLYQLAGDGRLRTVSLRDEGMTKATRLFHVESLRNFIESFERKGEES